MSLLGIKPKIEGILENLSLADLNTLDALLNTAPLNIQSYDTGTLPIASSDGAVSGTAASPGANTIALLTSNVASATTASSCTGNSVTATTATKLGTSTIGSSSRPMYLSAGTPFTCIYMR